MAVVGVDLGTSGVRAEVFAADCRSVAAAADTTVLHRERGFVRLDADAVLSTAEQVIAEALRRSGDERHDIHAIAFSCHGETVLPVDPNGAATDHAVVGMDVRGDESVGILSRTLGIDRVEQITGQPLHRMFSVHKIAALGSEPGGAAWREAAGFRGLTDFIAQSWGLPPTQDTSCAARTGAFDVDARAWSEEVLEQVEMTAPWVSAEVFSGTVDSGVPIGVIREDVATRIGLPRGVVLVAGGHDQACTYLGVDARPLRASALSFGSSDCVTVGSTERPRRRPGVGFASYPLFDDLWITLAGTAAGGWALEWLASFTGYPDVGTLMAEMSQEPARSMVLPYLSGSSTLDTDPDLRGALLGLSLDTRPGDVVRALVESAGFELARLIAAFRDIGIEPGEIRATGGGISDERVLVARASSAGVPLTLGLRHAAVRGAAALAARGIGSTLAPPVVSRTAVPDPRTEDWYAQRRTLYLASSEAVSPYSRRIPEPSIDHLNQGATL